jgi:NTE family protein
MATGAADGESTASFLRGVALFAELTDDLRQELAQAAERVDLPAGAWLFRQGDPADGLYVVSAGRLEVVHEDPEPQVIRVLSVGESVGELGLATDVARTASVRALRDSELIRVGNEQFADLLRENSAFAIALTRRLGHLLESTRPATPAVTRHMAVFTVVALQPSFSAANVAAQLTDALSSLGRATTLDGTEVGDGADRDHALAQAYSTVLDRCERDNDWVVLVASDQNGKDPWTQFCLRAADRVVAVADPAAGPPPSELPDAVAGCDLLAWSSHPDAGLLLPWLERLAPRAHHFIGPATSPSPSIARAARRLVGRSLGLVLSGGGARGMAHIGVIAALEDAGLHIDRLGGTSMGACIGALSAMGLSPPEMRRVCRAELVLRRPFNDYTIPRHSLIKARKAQAMLERMFAGAFVETLPRSFFSVSADLVTGREVVHRRGPLWGAVGSSMALPGLIAPVVSERRLLVDGGVLNNLPVDVMVATDEGPVIAVDVMRRPPPNEGHTLPVPPLLDTLSRATVLGSWQKTDANRELASLVIAPNLHEVGLLDFRRLDYMVEVGRRAATDALASSDLRV